MFKINYLELTGEKEERFKYSFDEGINYFKGVNSSGKTEFYKFIDYMFGSSSEIKNKEWFKGTLKDAKLSFEFNELNYELKRSIKGENFFRYADEEWSNSIALAEYREKLNSIFFSNVKEKNEIKRFTGEMLSFRTFTLFNFLGERSLGIINDFFTKSRDIKYSTKLSSILNYIFNDNLEKILKLQEELSLIESEIKELEKNLNRHNFLEANINKNLRKLGLSMKFSKKNKERVLEEISKIKSFEDDKKKSLSSKPTSELEVIYNNLDEQIRIYKNTIEDNKQILNENKNRDKMLKSFLELSNGQKDYAYLMKPLLALIKNIEKSISFNKYMITNSTLKELENQRNNVKNEIMLNESRFIRYDLSEKSRSIALLEEYLQHFTECDEQELDEKRKKAKSLKSEIKVLQNSNNEDKITQLSNNITELYMATKDTSGIVKNDSNLNGFYIKYYKKGNILQPTIRDETSQNEELQKNYYTGSMARHTLIQLCGYLGFLEMLLKDEKYPVIPMLVIDHISKPFDLKNKKAIGGIFEKFYEEIDTAKLQVFIFDDESPSDLGLKVNSYEDLVSGDKTGFNPFYRG